MRRLLPLVLLSACGIEQDDACNLVGTWVAAHRATLEGFAAGASVDLGPVQCGTVSTQPSEHAAFLDASLQLDLGDGVDPMLVLVECELMKFREGWRVTECDLYPQVRE